MASFPVSISQCCMHRKERAPSWYITQLMHDIGQRKSHWISGQHLVSHTSPPYAERAREGLGNRAHPTCILPGISGHRSVATYIELYIARPASAMVTYVHLPSRPTALIWFAVTKYIPYNASYILKIHAGCAQFSKTLSCSFSVGGAGVRD